MCVTVSGFMQVMAIRFVILFSFNRLVDAQDTVASRVAESQRAAAEWEAEKQSLSRSIDLHKRLLAAKGDNSNEDTNAFKERNSKLEELLTATREQSSMKIREREDEMKELKNQIRTLTVKLGNG